MPCRVVSASLTRNVDYCYYWVFDFVKYPMLPFLSVLRAFAVFSCCSSFFFLISLVLLSMTAIAVVGAAALASVATSYADR